MSDADVPRTLDEVLKHVLSHYPDATTTQHRPANRRALLDSIPMLERPDYLADSANEAAYQLHDFAAADDEDFLALAYARILQRDVDGAGRSYYLPALARGDVSHARVLRGLTRSIEGQTRGIRIGGLGLIVALERAARVPLIGLLARPFAERVQRRFRLARVDKIAERQRNTIERLNEALLTTKRNQDRLNIRLSTLERDTSNEKEAMDRAQTLADSALSEARAMRIEMARWRDGQRAGTRDAPEAGYEMDTTHLPTPAGIDSFYVAFENVFRGPKDEVRERSQRYLPLLKRCPPVVAGATVLDIGCGRGEFLTLLRDHTIAAKGVDLNSAMVNEARLASLDVVEGNALTFLRDQPSSSLAAISGFHIVEHLSFEALLTLFDEARRVLMPEGIVLFETPNPENLVVGACTFHYDPTHIRPLPPAFLKFTAEARGFTTTRIIRTDEDCDLDLPESGFEPNEVNDWFRQPRDYAVYAQKGADEGPS